MASIQRSRYYYNVDFATHDAKFREMVAVGYRMIDVCVSGTPPAVRYSACWVTGTPGQTRWEERSGLSQTSFQQVSSQLAAQGLTPICVSVAGPMENAVFAAIWETKTAATNESVTGVRQADIVANVQAHYAAGQVPIAVTEYGIASDRRYAILYSGKDTKQNTTWYYTQTPQQHQANFNAETSKPFWRPLSLTGSTGGFLCSTYCDYDNGATDTRHGVVLSDVENQLSKVRQQGWFVTNLQAYGDPNSPLYAIITVSNYPAANRQWQVQSAVSNVGVGSQLDSAMQKFMQRESVRHGQLAFARHGTLLFDHAYSWREPSHPTTAPIDSFLLASLSKAFCAAAVQVLYDRGIVGPSTAAYIALDLRTTPGVGDARLDAVTIQQLIDHTSGITYDPVFQAREVALAINGGSRPATAADFVAYMHKRPLDQAPGTYVYNNYGYVLLALVVERLGGEASYFDFLRKNVLQPNNLDVRFWPTAGSAHVNDRIKQESNSVGPSSLTPLSDVQVAAVYGGDDFVKEACVGPSSLAASASTLVRFLSNHAAWGVGGRVASDWREGSMPGARTWMGSRNNRLDVAIVFNTREFWDDSDNTAMHQNDFTIFWNEIASLVDSL